MENWGAILSFENALLLDPDLSPESAKQRVFTVLAHEMAHQWFGNLVTMAWWDDLWLNEGFASWMESKATDHFHPEWRIWLQAEADRERAMQQDAKRTTHPVVQPVRSGEQANQAFDAITYLKGQAVVRMLEDYVGEKAFRQGVHAYMRRYAYRNTTTTDFWAELEKTAEKPVRQIAEDFTLQPGVPLITVESAQTDGTRTTLSLKQGRFAMMRALSGAGLAHTDIRGGGRAGDLPASPLIAGRTSFFASVEGPPPIKINTGGTGYYRSQYTGEGFRSLAERLSALPPADQLGLLPGTWALGEVGLGPLQDSSSWFRSFRWMATSRLATGHGMLLAPDRLYAVLQGKPGFVRSPGPPSPRCSPRRLGRGGGESEDVAVLREDLLTALAGFVTPTWWTKRAGGFSLRCGPKEPSCSGPLADAQDCCSSADRTLYGPLYDLAKGTTRLRRIDSFWPRVRCGSQLRPAYAEDCAQQRAAARPGRLMIKQVAFDDPGPRLEFAFSHMDALSGRLIRPRSSFVRSLAAQSASPDRLQELRQFIDDRLPSRCGRKWSGSTLILSFA